MQRICIARRMLRFGVCVCVCVTVVQLYIDIHCSLGFDVILTIGSLYLSLKPKSKTLV